MLYSYSGYFYVLWQKVSLLLNDLFVLYKKPDSYIFTLQLHSSVKKMQGWGFEYLPSLL